MEISVEQAIALGKILVACKEMQARYEAWEGGKPEAMMITTDLLEALNEGLEVLYPKR